MSCKWAWHCHFPDSKARLSGRLLPVASHYPAEIARRVICKLPSLSEELGRPHSALDYQTPAAFAAKLTATGHHAALCDGSACRPVAHPAREGILMPRL